MAPKPPPRALKASPSLDFHRFLVEFGRFFDDFLYCRVREIGGQRAKPRDNLRYCSCGIVAGKKSISFFVAGTNRKCYKTAPRVLSWNKCLSSKTTCFAIYDCKPTTCQKPGFAAGELREGCGNTGFGGGFVSKIQNSGAGQGAGSHGLPMVLMVFQWFSWSFQA